MRSSELARAAAPWVSGHGPGSATGTAPIRNGSALRARWATHAPRVALFAVVVAGAFPLHALQLVDASDGIAVEAVVSIKEPTRVRIEGASITDVVGNIHSSSCGSTGTDGTSASQPMHNASALAPTTPSNPSGDVTIVCDRDKGEIYVRPVGDGPRPINLFVSSATATYTLLLRRADTPADTIVIRDKTPQAFRSTASDHTAAGPAPNHVRTMKALLVAMATDRVPSDIRVQEAGRTMQLWAEARFTLVRQYEGRGLTGEKYALQNIGTTAMVLAEQEFDRRSSSTAGEVAGISIEHHNLRPGESTSVYVLRRGGSR